MTIRAIAAQNRKGVIADSKLGGFKIPWHSKEDMAYFREKTKGSVVVMGRTTWETFGGKPLPNRTNVVLTTRELPNGLPLYQDPTTKVFYANDLGDVVETFSKVQSLDIWIIGGAQVYRAALPYTDEFYLTTIYEDQDGDVFLPPLEGFEVTSREEHLSYEPPLLFEVYRKK